MSQRLQTLLDTKMTRAEFLKKGGLILFVLSGVGGLFNTLEHNFTTTIKKNQTQSGFGHGKYGG